MSTKPSSEEPPETPDLQGAYPRLSDAQIAALAAHGRRRSTQPGEVLFAEGDRDCDFFVVLAGRVASVEGHRTPAERVIAVHGAGRFLGELSLLTGEGSYYSAVALDAAQVLAVPVGRLRDLVARDPAFGDLILRAYLLRRSILIGLGTGLRIVGSRYSPDTRRVRDFAARNRLPCRWLDLEADPSAEALLAQFGLAPQDTPVVIVHGRLLRNPSNAELAAAVGLPAPVAPQASCDLLVVGRAGRPVRRRVRGLGGDAGHRPGRHGRRRPGGNLVADRELPRLPVRYLRRRVGRTGGAPGAEVRCPVRRAGRSRLHRARRRSLPGAPRRRASLTSPLVVLATGARYRRLAVPRADYFEQMSIYYAASQAEALLCAGDPVAIVGGGNSAGQAAVFLSGTRPGSRSSSANPTCASTCPATSSTRSRGSRTCRS